MRLDVGGGFLVFQSLLFRIEFCEAVNLHVSLNLGKFQQFFRYVFHTNLFLPSGPNDMDIKPFNIFSQVLDSVSFFTILFIIQIG